MKSKLMLLPAALLLVFALTACGGGMNQGDGQTNANGQTGSAVTGSQSDSAKNQNQTGDAFTDNRTGSAGDGLVNDARDALTGANDLVEDAMDGGAVRQTHQGASYDQMVRNGRVHDRDGDLTDMENSATPGSTSF